MVDVHGVEGAGGGEIAGAVADEEVGGARGEVPDVCFDAGAAPAEGFEEGDAAPVVVVGVAVDGLHVAGEAGVVALLVLVQGEEVVGEGGGVIFDEVD